MPRSFVSVRSRHACFRQKRLRSWYKQRYMPLSFTNNNHLEGYLPGPNPRYHTTDRRVLAEGVEHVAFKRKFRQGPFRWRYRGTVSELMVGGLVNCMRCMAHCSMRWGQICS